jgi:hypothetical protein
MPRRVLKAVNNWSTGSVFGGHFRLLIQEMAELCFWLAQRKTDITRVLMSPPPSPRDVGGGGTAHFPAKIISSAVLKSEPDEDGTPREWMWEYTLKRAVIEPNEVNPEEYIVIDGEPEFSALNRFESHNDGKLREGVGVDTKYPEQPTEGVKILMRPIMNGCVVEVVDESSFVYIDPKQEPPPVVGPTYRFEAMNAFDIECPQEDPGVTGFYVGEDCRGGGRVR